MAKSWAGIKSPSDWDELSVDDKAEMIAHYRVMCLAEALQIQKLTKGQELPFLN